jgi:8-oxo-dGTP pyrophosphatase MutT (NUDIX family)
MGLGRGSSLIVKAAGIMFVCKGKVLLMRRVGDDLAGFWGFPGGKLEDGETLEECARRESLEESGFDYRGPLKLWTRRVTPDVDFSAYIARVPEEFEAKLNEEHDSWAWVPRDLALGAPKLHPGDHIALRRFDMDELDVAKAMVAGELTSPQTYENLMLVAIRITGTGGSYRPAHDEYVWRDPSLYMTPQFLERCNGLPVIFRHPKKTLLNTEEFRDRIVGTVFVPFMKPPDEVWAIAKIIDMKAAELLKNYEMSTSPAVLCLGKKIPTEDGKKLIIESKPYLLDHIALLIPETDADGKVINDGVGVWDVGEGLSGVASVDAQPVVLDEGPSELDVIANAILSRKIDELCSR